jgi:pyridoxal phosphate enzyme (YggS family)
MRSIQANIDALHSAISQACEQSGRAANSVQLMAVSKTRTASEIRRAAASGILHIGENYLQEATEKIASLADIELTWHFIGAIQSNKTRDIATHFDWVHTVDRNKIARRLNQHCIEANHTLNVCIQVNIDKEPQKAGLSPENISALVDEIIPMKGLCLRGLMAIPRPPADTPNTLESQIQNFTRLTKLFEQQIDRKIHLPAWDTLSMGMSGDYIEAIHAGSTIVRVGTAIFGPRSNQSDNKVHLA